MAGQGTYTLNTWSAHSPGQGDVNEPPGGYLMNGSEVYMIKDEDEYNGTQHEIQITKRVAERTTTDMEIELVNYSDKVLNVVLVDG